MTNTKTVKRRAKLNLNRFTADRLHSPHKSNDSHLRPVACANKLTNPKTEVELPSFPSSTISFRVVPILALFSRFCIQVGPPWSLGMLAAKACNTAQWRRWGT